jgi:RNA polymerase sigma factor (TIGR02999 family)
LDHPGEITELLKKWGDGKEDALAPLFELVYPKLRQIAGFLFRQENPNHVLQPTGVVNEFYLKFIRQQTLRFEDREHFFSLAARLMRRILVDYARQRQTAKRDGGVAVALSEESAWVVAPGAELLDLDRALEELRTLDERKSRIVDLRFFLGFTLEETAEITGTSKATVDRELKFARGWIQDWLQRS